MSMPLQPLLARTLLTALLGFQVENAGGELFYLEPVVNIYLSPVLRQLSPSSGTQTPFLSV
jgi:hypothetical protein